MLTSNDRLGIVLLYAAGLSYREIANLKGVTRQHIQQIVSIPGLRKPGPTRSAARKKRKTQFDRDRDRVVFEFSKILTDWSIGRICDAVYGPSYKTRVPARPPILLYPCQYVEVSNLWNSGLNYAQISDLLGLSVNRVASSLQRARGKGIQCRKRAYPYRPIQTTVRPADRARISTNRLTLGRK